MTVEKGVVMAQTPSAATVAEAGQTVTLTVSSGKPTVTMPSLTGKSYADAVKALEELGLMANVTTTTSSSGASNRTVVSQTPAANTSVEVGSVVDLTVYRRSSTRAYTVPNIVGMTSANAGEAVEDANLSLTTTTAYSNTVPAGTVISQNPVANSQALSRNSTVYAVVSLGPEPKKVVIPTVTGMTRDDAVAALTAAGFTSTVTLAYSDTVPEGSVISQSPEGNTEALTTQVIALTVSRGVYDPSAMYATLNYTDALKAVWISQFDISSTYTQSSESNFRTQIAAVMSDISTKGFNTVIVQVRPNGDSFYPSEYYPWSKYVLGSYSKTATKSYDPFEILIDEAHKLNLSVQAWINPLRLMSTSEITNIADNYLIKQWYNDSSKKGKYIVEYSGTYYLNPAYEEVRNLIINGAVEICEKYNVDGVHMDDYFYPTTDSSFDSAAYQASGYSKLASFRKNNLNLLVSGMYSAIKAIDSNILYGISPAGNLTSVESTQYAEVSKWCSTDGYIDYIMPQIYWGFKNEYSPFITRVDEWVNATTNENVKLYIGLALYKAADEGSRRDTDGTEWADYNDILKRQIEHLVNNVPKCDGIAAFSYKYLSASQYPTGEKEVTGMLEAMKKIV